MEFAADTKREKRQIGGKNEAGVEIKFEIDVPQPFAAGATTLTDGMANALNQTLAENLSNNLRAKLIAGKPEVKDGDTVTSPARPYTPEEAQALADEYLKDYEIGVRRAGSGEARVTDPVEREARKIAREKAIALIKAQGGKPGDYDLGPLVDQIFAANKDMLMSEGKKIVAAAERARKAAETGGFTVEGITLAPKPKAEPAAATGNGAAS